MDDQSMMMQRMAMTREVVALGGAMFRLRLHVPEIARMIRPGQFVMIKAHGRLDPLLGRPLALYDVVRNAAGEVDSIDVVFVVMGAGTRALSMLREGDTCDVWGPLGNTFPSAAAEVDLSRLLVIAGGIGQTPFVAVTRELLGKEVYGGAQSPATKPMSIRVAWGARTAALLAGAEDFTRAGAEIHLATEDGSLGRKGRSTDVARELLHHESATAIFACGPEPMLEAVAKLAAEVGVPAWVSLETKMACGYGVCFSCVSPVHDATSACGWDYRRVCLEGPVFPAENIAWGQMRNA